MTLGELLFTGPEEADAIEKHTLGPRDHPRASSPMCLLTSSLCQQEGLAGTPAAACALLAHTAHPEFQGPLCPVSHESSARKSLGTQSYTFRAYVVFLFVKIKQDHCGRNKPIDK